MKNSSIPISVIILTHRNDARFKKAVSSAQPAKEILILDYHSDNDWKKLKKDNNFTLVERSGPIENFAKERNIALKKAKHDWVFFLDSDEEIATDSWIEIQSLLQDKQSENIDGFFVQRNDVFYNKVLKFGETGGAEFLRIIRKNKAKYLRPIHESAEVSGVTEHTDVQLIHYAHQDITEFLKDITHYASLEAEYQKDSELSELSLGIKTIIYPKTKFLHNYFLKLGFLDGWRGLVYAVCMSLHSFMVRVFSYENT